MAKQVMIVDDNRYVRDSVEIICQGENLGVVTAASGEECLRKLEEGFRGVILMDVMMPEMDGWDTIRALIEKELYPGNVIVMLTGMGEPDTKMDGVQEYVTDYMTKPFNPEELIQSLRYYLALVDELQ
ncbi:response regulator [Geomonas sp. Red276]